MCLTNRTLPIIKAFVRGRRRRRQYNCCFCMHFWLFNNMKVATLKLRQSDVILKKFHQRSFQICYISNIPTRGTVFRAICSPGDDGVKLAMDFKDFFFKCYVCSSVIIIYLHLPTYSKWQFDRCFEIVQQPLYDLKHFRCHAVSQLYSAGRVGTAPQTVRPEVLRQ